MGEFLGELPCPPHWAQYTTQAELVHPITPRSAPVLFTLECHSPQDGNDPQGQVQCPRHSKNGVGTNPFSVDEALRMVTGIGIFGPNYVVPPAPFELVPQPPAPPSPITPADERPSPMPTGLSVYTAPLAWFLLQVFF